MDFLVFGFDSDRRAKYFLLHLSETLALLLFRVSAGIPTKNIISITPTDKENTLLLRLRRSHPRL
jgi:hypothetical protein